MAPGFPACKRRFDVTGGGWRRRHGLGLAAEAGGRLVAVAGQGEAGTGGDSGPPSGLEREACAHAMLRCRA